MDSFSTLNIDALNDWIRERNPAIGTVVQAEKFAGGQSNPTYRIATSAGNYVLRTKPGPAGKLLRSAHAIDREFRIMSALSKTDVPVPKVIDLCHDESVLGRDFFLMEYVDGRIFWEQALPGLDAGQRKDVYLEMNSALARLHSLDYKRLGLEDFGTPGNYLSRQISRWTTQYRESNPPDLPAMERLIAWLPDNIPGSDEVSVIHGDYRLDNMVFASSGTRLLAILDWELSTLGHPLVDLANHCLSWHLTSTQFRGLADFDVEALGIPSERNYLERYCALTGREFSSVARHWNYFIAFSLFRMAAIAQGIAHRAELGVASNRKAQEAAGLVEPFSTLGSELASDRGAGTNA